MAYNPHNLSVLADLHAKYDGPIPEHERDAALRAIYRPGSPAQDLKDRVALMLMRAIWAGELKGRRDWGTMNWVRTDTGAPISIETVGIAVPSAAAVREADDEVTDAYRDVRELIDQLWQVR